MKTVKFLNDLKDLSGTDLDGEQRTMVAKYISFLERKLKLI